MQKGYKHNDETKKKLKESAFKRNNTHRIAALPRGESHWNYSENPSRLALHKRLYRKYGKASSHKCIDCENKARDWSNQTGNYSDKLEDYVPRCRKCHIKKDGNNRNGVKVWLNLKRRDRGQFLKSKL